MLLVIPVIGLVTITLKSGGRIGLMIGALDTILGQEDGGTKAGSRFAIAEL